MTKFTEILRLKDQGLSQRQIAASLQISRNTIKEFFSRLEASGITLPPAETITDNYRYQLQRPQFPQESLLAASRA